jgi:hypothetical protein
MEEKTKDLKCAIKSWPFFIIYIAKYAEIGTCAEWKNVIAHKYFHSSSPSRGNIFSHLAEIYGVISCNIWNRPELADILLFACKSILREPNFEDQYMKKV